MENLHRSINLDRYTINIDNIQQVILKPALGSFCTLDPLGYHFKQLDVMFMVLGSIIGELSDQTTGEHQLKLIFAVLRTCSGRSDGMKNNVGTNGCGYEYLLVQIIVRTNAGWYKCLSIRMSVGKNVFWYQDVNNTYQIFLKVLVYNTCHFFLKCN